MIPSSLGERGNPAVRTKKKDIDRRLRQTAPTKLLSYWQASGGILTIRVNTMARSVLIGIVRRGVVAGAAGGVAEILWISIYSAATGANAATLARGVTTAAGVSALLPAAPVAVGIIIHMTLAVALGIALAFVWRSLSTYWPERAGLNAFVLVVLAGVWAINFFIVLPLISPDFVPLVPYPISLLSKLLFGVAAAAVLGHRARDLTARLAPQMKSSYQTN
jgi:hypothetical protein